jgi:hypothetical protein
MIGIWDDQNTHRQAGGKQEPDDRIRRNAATPLEPKNEESRRRQENDYSVEGVGAVEQRQGDSRQRDVRERVANQRHSPQEDEGPHATGGDAHEYGDPE